MKKWLIFLLFLGSCSTSSIFEDLRVLKQKNITSLNKAISKLDDSIVHLKTFCHYIVTFDEDKKAIGSVRNSLATGFFIETSNNKVIIVTAGHVVNCPSRRDEFEKRFKNENIVKIEVKPFAQIEYKQNTYDVKVLVQYFNAQSAFEDYSADYAFLEVELPKDKVHKSLPVLAKGNKYDIWSKIIMWSYIPYNEGWILLSVEGRVAKFLGDLMQTNIPVVPGNSGGPLVFWDEQNNKLYAVGIIVSNLSTNKYVHTVSWATYFKEEYLNSLDEFLHKQESASNK